tara:strand:+ start:88 stop:237 length:150 start_codon:yes stop_codon:yes gene_type:complete
MLNEYINNAKNAGNMIIEIVIKSLGLESDVSVEKRNSELLYKALDDLNS